MAQRLQYQNVALRLIEDTQENRDLISRLFQLDDVKRYFTLSDDLANDMNRFVQYLSNANVQRSGLNFIIEDTRLSPVGIITAEPYQDNMTGELSWNIGFAVLEAHRNRGYAKGALMGLQDHFAHCSRIETMMLDISSDDKAAESVAKACGYKQKRSPYGGLVGYYDEKHPELGMRTQWEKKIRGTDTRGEAIQKATDAYLRKDYQEAIKWYYAAVEEPYQEGSLATDAIIYSNLGMAYSSIREYKKAYLYLTKAWNLGCQNASVSKELQWLRNHAADQI